MRTDRFRIYRSEDREQDYLGKIRAYLDDRPGSLASLANLFAGYGINILYFSYNRSEHPNRVLVEVMSGDAKSLRSVRDSMLNNDLLESRRNQSMELGVTDIRNILRIDVRLENVPGTLGGLASMLQKHNANVIYLTYDSEISETTAAISMATKDAAEIDRLLKDMNEHGYDYSIKYNGAGQREVDDIIGLNLIERFFLRLRQLLHTEDIKRLRRLVESSRLLTENLVNFSNEMGKHYQEGEVLTNILAFATASRSTTGPAFTYHRLPSLTFGPVVFHAFKIPTGANIYLLEGDEELVMIDGSYGHYYEDVKAMLRQCGLDPSRVKRIYITHADPDHAGMSGYFAEEFGTQVYQHRRARGVLERQNRLWGTNSPIEGLNQYFTILVNTLTEMKVSHNWKEYGDSVLGRMGGFDVIDSFSIAGQVYRILECTAGHVSDQVFIVGMDSGLVFTADYLLLTESLTQSDRAILNLPKMMLTSTNADSVLFRKEMESLRRFILDFDDQLSTTGREVIVAPGHGDYYKARLLNKK
ncbi:MAG TPA: MBL fold metallo-hydrolase [Dissulfurispiraceae bacterium]|nr:MBL fold metallo-hydrolase [Dissulfurispiraceae bacterium]